MVLAPNKGKTYAKFEQKISNVGKQSLFEVALLHRFADRQEVEGVGIVEELLGKIGIRCGQRARAKFVSARPRR